MEDTFLNTKEVAELLNIHEKQVYALIKAKRIPCTRVTGKWLFPQRLLEDWIKEDALKSIGSGSRAHDEYLLAAGSNDPVLDVLLNSIKKDNDSIPIYSASTGSIDGLERLAQGKTNIAFCHLYDYEKEGFNIDMVNNSLTNQKFAVVHLFYRQIGFLVSQSFNEKITSFKEIISNSLTFVNRQKGAGTRLLIDHLLEDESIQGNQVDGYNDEVYTHLEVALKIINKTADIGVGTVAMASLFNLKFYPLLKESFDMVMLQNTFFTPTIQSAIKQLASDDFKQGVKHMGDYDFSNSGAILHSS